MRCPACGARNAAGAAWCTQCYARLGEPVTDPSARAAEGPTGALADTDAGTTGDEPPGTDRPRDAATRDVRTVDGEVEWRCATCGSWSRLGASACVTCGSPRRGFGELTPPRTLDASARGKLLLASALLPGLGHLLAGRVGTGVARVVLTLTWGVGALVILGGTGRGAGLLPAVPLLLGVVALWTGSLRDTTALIDGGDELLRPRVLTWLASGVLAAVILAVVLVAGGSNPAR